ncbi:unnamed protein product [Natator depressus]
MLLQPRAHLGHGLPGPALPPPGHSGVPGPVPPWERLRRTRTPRRAHRRGRVCAVQHPAVPGGRLRQQGPRYACYCPNGYYYETHHLECIDNDECLDEEAEPCVGGGCVNTIGSFYCACTPPLVLDGVPAPLRGQRQPSPGREPGRVLAGGGADLVCSRPRLDRQVTYTECCCLYGEAWGMDCALCPARDSDDFEALCNVLRPPSYGPARPGLGLPYEYGPEFVPGYGLPYGPELFASSAARGPQPGLRPDYDPYALGGYAGRRDSLYSSPTYEAGDFEDVAYVDARPEEPPAPYRRPDAPRTYRPRSPPDPEPGPAWHYPPNPASPFPEQPGQASETHTERLEGLQAEECGVLNGCENGRCVRVPDGFTCHCHPGFRLDTAHMACLDIDECAEAEGPPALCLNGGCLNTDGSYRCLCPRGYVLTPAPPLLHPCPAPGLRGDRRARAGGRGQGGIYCVALGLPAPWEQGAWAPRGG